MAGRGRGRGALARWGAPSGQPFGGGFDGRAVASVPPLKKENASQRQERRVSCVRVTCIIDVNHFWAQLGSASELNHFDQYIIQLNQWCNSRDAESQTSQNEIPVVGQVVCVRHAASGKWRRAEVTRLSQRMADVFFLDYGQAECVPVDALCRGVPSDVTAWPPQALYCTLDGVQPINNENQWSDSAIHRFDELVNCGSRIIAYHDQGSFQLALFIIDDHGIETSISSILASEGFAQEITADDGTAEFQNPPWRDEPPRQRQPPNKEKSKPLDREQLEQLEKLEQQLMMSGFTYLIPPSHEAEQAPNTKDLGFGPRSSTTTISSTFFQYKGKHGDVHHGITGIKHEHEPGLSGMNHYQQFPKDLGQPGSASGHSVPQVVASGPGFGSASPREGSRGHSPGSYGSHPSTGRPHLASPGEFMSTSKAPTLLSTRPTEQTTAFTIQEEKPARYIPPHLRMEYLGEGQSEASSEETELDRTEKWARENSLVTNVWSPNSDQASYREQERYYPESNTTATAHLPPGMAQGYGMEKQLPHPQGESLQQSNFASFSAFHGPKLGRHSLAAIFNAPPVKSNSGEISQLQAYSYHQQQQQQQLPPPPQQEQQQQQKPPQQQSQMKSQFTKHFEPLKVQQTTDNANDKAMKNELEWQKWKVQRNIKKILDKATADNVEESGCSLADVIAQSRLSQNFEGMSEVLVMLEMINERVIDRKGFSRIAAQLCMILSGLNVARFLDHFSSVVMAFRDDLVDQFTINNWRTRCERYCSFLGELYVAVNMDDETNRYGTLRPVLKAIVEESLKIWTSLNENNTEAELGVYTACLTCLLKIIGPAIDEAKSSDDEIGICELFDTTMREHVLSPQLTRPVKEGLLDLMLHRAYGWPVQSEDEPEDSQGEEQSIDTNEEVVVEAEEDGEDEARESQEAQDEEEWDGEQLDVDESEWDPYAKVTAMLHLLKLGDLFPKFKDNCIRDSLLTANKEEFKKTLQEAGFPPGVILEIRMFLDKGHFPVKSKPSSHKTADPVTTSNNGTTLPNEQQPLPSRESSTSRETTPTEQIPQQKSESTEDDGRIEVSRLNRELHELMSQENTGGGTSLKRIPSPKGHHTQHSLDGTPYSRQTSKPERTRRSSSEHTQEESKSSLIMASHNTFEPSYLSRTPPLRVDTAAFEFDIGPVSPSAQGPMTYSAVLKAKNEETSPELPSKAVPVKFTALTKNTSEGSKESQVSPKTPTGKPAAEDAKEGAGKRDQKGSFPRPPPGFPPLPPQTWGQGKGKGSEIRLTVLNSRQRGKSEDGGGGILGTAPESEPAAWTGRQGGDHDGSGARGRDAGGQVRGAWRGGRGGGAFRGNTDSRHWRDTSDRSHTSSPSWSNRSSSGSISWRERTERQEEKQQMHRDVPESRVGMGGFDRHDEKPQGVHQREAPVSRGGFGAPRGSDSSRTVRRPSPDRVRSSYGGGFYENPAPPIRRPFGPGGPKACFTCGSKEHLECNDRSKMFLD